MTQQLGTQVSGNTLETSRNKYENCITLIRSINILAWGYISKLFCALLCDRYEDHTIEKVVECITDSL